MKKIIFGFLAILFAGQISYAQPVSDMAVIPMGITIQNIMRLTITRGGNIEFVFKSADDRTNGLSGTAYTTAGTIVASQAWDLDLAVDEAAFTDESGSATTIALNVVELEATATATSTLPATPGTAIAANTPLAAFVDEVIGQGPVTNGDTFTIQWACGTTTAILATTPAGRYTANVILSLIADN